MQFIFMIPFYMQIFINRLSNFNILYCFPITNWWKMMQVLMIRLWSYKIFYWLNIWAIFVAVKRNSIWDYVLKNDHVLCLSCENILGINASLQMRRIQYPKYLKGLSGEWYYFIMCLLGQRKVDWQKKLYWDC